MLPGRIAGLGSTVAMSTTKSPRKVHEPASFAVSCTAPSAAGATE